MILINHILQAIKNRRNTTCTVDIGHFICKTVFVDPPIAISEIKSDLNFHFASNKRDKIIKKLFEYLDTKRKADEILGGLFWPYTNAPCLGIRLKTGDGVEYPLGNEELVMIDTGYDGELCLPGYLYEELGFNMWEESDPDEFGLADGSSIYLKAAQGYILIPKLTRDQFPVRVHSAYEAEQDTNEIIIGVKFIKQSLFVYVYVTKRLTLLKGFSAGDFLALLFGGYLLTIAITTSKLLPVRYH